MKLQVFAVFDSKAESYLQPFYALAVGAAIRSFSDAANSESHEFHKHAGDFTLFHLGAFDQLSGQFELLPAAINMGTALQFREASKPQLRVEA